MTREAVEEMYNQIKTDKKTVKLLETAIHDNIIDYRIKSVCRILDDINIRVLGNKCPNNIQLNIIITHCLNKLNGNIDGVEINVPTLIFADKKTEV